MLLDANLSFSERNGRIHACCIHCRNKNIDNATIRSTNICKFYFSIDEGYAVEYLVLQYLQLKYSSQLEPRELANHRAVQAPEQLRKAIQVKKDWTMTWWEQFRILSKRTFKGRWRDYFDALRLIQALGVALLLGMLWWDSKTATEAQLRDQVYG